MMNEEKNDGPAFPVQYETGGRDNSQITYFGISVRDYFAAKAMATLIDQDDDDLREWVTDPEEGMPSIKALAVASYEIADAMIAERNKP